jgi:hypothetical protein
MSIKSNDGGNGFKNSRIDLSQLGDDNWNKSFAGKSAAPDLSDRRRARTRGERTQPANLEDLFESRVQAATAERAVNQNRGQSRIWLFAGGLLVASLGGIAAAYYLVGPPAATSAYEPGLAGTGKLDTASLLVDNTIEDSASSHFQGVAIAANVSASSPVESNEPSQGSSSDASLAAPPQVNLQSASETVLQKPAPSEVSGLEVEVATPASSDKEPEIDKSVVAPVEQTPVLSSEPEKVAVESEQLVHIAPAAGSGETETKTNVNISKDPTAPRKTIGQWLAVPADTGLGGPSVVTAATSQQSTQTRPSTEPVKTQQELFRSFQAYLEITGYAETIDQPGQKALFKKFIRWSMEAPAGN